MLTLADREEISRGLAEGLEYKQIGVLIGRNPSVVSREVARHGGRGGTGPRPPKRRRRCPAAAEDVGGGARAGAAGGGPGAAADGLVTGVDRGPVAVRLPRRSGLPGVSRGDLPVGVCPAGVHPGAGADRLAHRPHGPPWRCPAGSGAADPGPPLPGRTPRRGRGPAGPRALEGDLVIGKGGKSAVATLVERTSRFVVLVPLTGRDALTVGDAIIAAAGTLPPQFARSLTWDCGSEMAGHARITAAGLPVYFARPHSPWQRGSNENANRILREYFPKGVPITSDPKYLAMVASEINDRPRKIHSWKKPSEIFTELVEANASTG